MIQPDAKLNAKLLNDLRIAHGCQEWGDIGCYFDVGVSWRCPGCQRSKSEIARVDKNSRLLCAIFLHHDHYMDEMSAKLPNRDKADFWAISAVRDSLTRFSATHVCSDCNNADTAAKRIVAAPAAFSFAPFEIAHFIEVKLNQSHTVNSDRAWEAYEAALPSMKLLSSRLRAVIAAGESDGTTFEPVGQAIWRVLNETKRKMNAAE